MPREVFGDSYAVLSERSYRDGESPAPSAYSLIKLNSGGYAFAGQGLQSKTWVVKTDAGTEKVWEALIAGTRGATQTALAIAESAEGVLLVTGFTNSHDLVVGDWKQDEQNLLYRLSVHAEKGVRCSVRSKWEASLAKAFKAN